VDAESVGRAGAHLELAERYFAPTEVAALRTSIARAAATVLRILDAEGKLRKARGVGLGLPLDRFAFLFDPGHSPHFHVDPGWTTRRFVAV
jgi:4'-phosphopantetheinyl transferase